jgi:hypothetical protein
MTLAHDWQRAGIAVVAAAVAFGVGAALHGKFASMDPEGEVVDPVVRPATRPAMPATAPDSSASGSRLDAAVAFNPFGPLNQGLSAALGQPNAVAPAPKPKKVKQEAPPPPPSPAVPTLPFLAIGSLTGAEIAGGRPVAFLQQHDQLLVVHAGQSIGDTYRVESITPQRIEFVYLPLMQRQSLPLAP